MNPSLRLATVVALTMALPWQFAVAEEDQTAEKTRQARLEQIRGVLQALRPTLLRDKRETQVKLNSTPALFYADNARDLTNSSLWVWEEAGQPVGVTALEWHSTGENQGRWTFEFASLCSERIRIIVPADTWTTSTAGSAAPIRDAPAVAGSRSPRLIQMKRLWERFSAVEQHPTEGRIQLRRLTAPVYTPSADGTAALFVFANGTNPEVALLITVVDDDNEKSWGYRAAALSATELAVSLDDRVVWNEAPFTRPGTRGTYTNGVLKVETDVKSDSATPKAK
jgi:pimeloyl-ACP methyl ester carboxylesterase